MYNLDGTDMENDTDNRAASVPRYVHGSILTTINEEPEEESGRLTTINEEPEEPEEERGRVELGPSLLDYVLSPSQVGTEEVPGAGGIETTNVNPTSMPPAASIVEGLSNARVEGSESGLSPLGRKMEASSLAIDEEAGFPTSGPKMEVSSLTVDEEHWPAIGSIDIFTKVPEGCCLNHTTCRKCLWRLSRAPVTTAPPEILSRIFFFTIIRPAANRQIPHKSGAFDLLHISHVCSLFRAVTFNTPTLWALVPFLNDARPRFLALIMARSKCVPLTVSVVEDEALSTISARSIWTHLYLSFDRVASLRIEIAEGCGGFNLMMMLSMPAPWLEECTIIFHGQRNVCIDSFYRGYLAFDGRAPQLHTLHLVNCYIHPRLCDFPSLITTSFSYVGDRNVDPNSDPLMTILPIFEWGHDFFYLQHLTIANAIQPAQPRDLRTLMDLPPAQLPHLQSFVITASPELCDHVISILRLPPTCSRIVNLVFSQLDRLRIYHARRVAGVACAFVSPDVYYVSCAIDIGDHRSSLCLRGTGRANVVITFDTPELKVHPSALAHLIDIFTFPVMAAIHKVTSSDLFRHRLWQSLACNLRPLLKSVRTLGVSLEAYQPPQILFDFFRALAGVETITTSHFSLWNYLCFATPSGDITFPNLRSIEVPLDDITVVATMDSLVTFLERHGDIQSVTFRVSSRWLGRMGFAASEEIRCVVATIAENFPASVALRWVKEEDSAQH